VIFKHLFEQALQAALVITLDTDKLNSSLLLSGPSHLRQSHGERSCLVRRHHM